MKSLLSVAVATGVSVATLSACGQSDADKEAKYREDFVAACTKNALGSGVSQSDADKMCDCSVDKVVEQMGTGVINLPPPMVDKILDECIAETGLTSVG